jgi:hypothetical protein
MKRLFLTTVATATLAFGAAAAEAAEEVTYLFPAPDFLPAFAPFQLAKAKGYFEEAGLDVTFRVGKGAPTSRPRSPPATPTSAAASATPRSSCVPTASMSAGSACSAATA